ncbi:MAG: hypothetical protein DME57_04185 [Verrucomicrobia bacterium]|nr:MAG: hypothetical protein DME57_04185 [Verrucomicrobiota bacterium]
MIYDLSLQTLGLIAGIALIVLSLPGLFLPAPTQDWFKRFPRSGIAGVVLLTIALVWSFCLLATMEMGEFAGFRKPLLVLLPISYVLVLRFVEEFLPVRALGIVCLLAAEPLLEAAFFRYETSRLFLTALAYLMIVAGLFWVTMPYLFRDQIDWSARNNIRWRAMHGIAAAYGVTILACAFTQY